VTIVDCDPGGDKASTGNAGGIAVTEVVPSSMPGQLWRVPGWLLDPLGPLSIRPRHALHLMPWLFHFIRAGRSERVDAIAAALAALNDRALADWGEILEELHLIEHLHRAGALTVYESTSAFVRDRVSWDLRRGMGIVCEPMSGAEARKMESALGPNVEHAMWTPQWSHVSDPKRIVSALLAWVRSRSSIVTGMATEVHCGSGKTQIRMSDGRAVKGEALVIAAGAWSRGFCRQLGESAVLESERGYNTTITDPGIVVQREIIFAEQHFVATPLACGLRIGGAAEFGGLNAPPNYERSNALVSLARRYFPDLRAETGTKWMGHRPATPDTLPVIGSSARHENVFYAFGHGHLGLTQGPTTGRLIAELAGGRPSLDLAPYSIGRFTRYS
jgi:D-amino-acid dehydrogenase